MASPRQTLCKDRTNSGGSVATTIATVGATPNLGGNTLVAVAVCGSAANSCSGITDSASNTYVRLGASFVNATLAETVDVFVCQNPVALAANTGTVTATFTGTGNARELIVVEMPGQWSNVHSGGNSNGASSTPAAKTITTTDALAIVLGVIAYRSNTAPTVGGSFTLHDSQNHSAGTAVTTAIAYRQESAIVTDGPPFTLPASLASVAFTFDLVVVTGASLVVVATLTAAGSHTAVAGATLTAASTITIGALVTEPAAATLTAASTLTVAGSDIKPGAAALTAAATLTVGASTTFAGTFADSAAGNHPLTVVGAVQTVGGKSGNGAQLDGSSGYLRGGQINAALGIGGTSPWTVEGWIKRARTSVATAEHVFSAYGLATGTQVFRLYFSAGANVLRAVGENSGNVAVGVNSAASITDTTTWHHVAICYDGTKVWVALDGAVSSVALSGIASQAGRADFAIGAAFTGASNVPAEFFQGAVDEVRVSSTARYVAAYTVPSAPLTVDGSTTALWPLEQIDIAAVTLTAASTLTVGALVTEVAAVTLTAASTLTVGPLVTELAAVALTAASTLTADAGLVRFGAATLTAASTLTVDGTTTKLAALALTAAASLSADGTAERVGTATMTATTALSVSATVSRLAAVLLEADTALTAGATLTRIGAAAMIAAVTLAVAGDVIPKYTRRPFAGVSSRPTSGTTSRPNTGRTPQP